MSATAIRMMGTGNWLMDLYEERKVRPTNLADVRRDDPALHREIMSRAMAEVGFGGKSVSRASTGARAGDVTYADALREKREYQKERQAQDDRWVNEMLGYAHDPAYRPEIPVYAPANDVEAAEDRDVLELLRLSGDKRAYQKMLAELKGDE